MNNLTDLVPPLELCKLIPEGEFTESPFVWVEEWAYDTINGKEVECFIYLELSSGYLVVNPKPTEEVSEDIFNATGKRPVRAITPAPTLEEILEELRKNQEDVFLKWSETAYNAWLVNAYTHDKEDYQAHDKSGATAALKVWLKQKGIEDGK